MHILCLTLELFELLAPVSRRLGPNRPREPNILQLENTLGRKRAGQSLHEQRELTPLRHDPPSELRIGPEPSGDPAIAELASVRAQGLVLVVPYRLSARVVAVVVDGAVQRVHGVVHVSILRWEGHGSRCGGGGRHHEGIVLHEIAHEGDGVHVDGRICEGMMGGHEGTTAARLLLSGYLGRRGKTRRRQSRNRQTVHTADVHAERTQ